MLPKMIKIDIWTGGYMVINCDEFFPLTQIRMRAFYQKILRGARCQPEIMDELIRYIDDRLAVMDLEYSQYDDPDYEKSHSPVYKRLLSNLDLLTHYRDKLRR